MTELKPVLPESCWTMSYPEHFIGWLDERPTIDHDPAARRITADEGFVRSVFHYEKLEEGCYLFLVDISARQDTLYRLKGDTATDYYCLSYQVSTGPVVRMPGKPQQHEKALSLPRVCSFYNHNYQYDVRFPGGARAQSALFCFTKEWLERSVDLEQIEPDLDFMKVVQKAIDCVVFLNNHFYSNTLDELLRIVSTGTGDPFYSLEVKKLSLTLIHGLFRMIYRSQREPHARPTGIDAAIGYLRQHYRDGFPGLEKLAQIAHMTVPTFSRQFRKAAGRSAYDFFQELQMEYACERLKKGDSVKEVAYTLGYASPGNFTRIFKKQYNITPGQLLLPGR